MAIRNYGKNCSICKGWSEAWLSRLLKSRREHGDLKENAEYHAAKDRQGHIEGRILELKDKLSRAEVIDCLQVSTNSIVFGTVVAIARSRHRRRDHLSVIGTGGSRCQKRFHLCSFAAWQEACSVKKSAMKCWQLPLVEQENLK